MKILKLSLVALIIIFTACKENINNPPPKPNNNVESMNELVVADNFNYNTSDETEINLYALDNSDNPITKVRFDVYTDYPDSGGTRLISGLSDYNGAFHIKRTIPSYINEVVVGTDFIGLANLVKLPVVNNSIIYTFGGKQSRNRSSMNQTSSITPSKKLAGTNAVLKYLGTYNNQGVPNYLISPNDNISNSLLQDINSSLPEYRPVPQYNPEYLAIGNETNLVLNKDADVWVTFVHEGAGYRNVLLFYTYPKDSAPSSVSEIDTLTVIFPNVSFKYSGGGLYSGNKVKIGTFDKNTCIGWALLANGWRNGQIKTSGNIYYSNPALNPESTSSKRIHNVLLVDPGRDIILLGFEDLNRDGWCDNDFNDAIFFVTSNPITAPETSNLEMISYSDNDGDKDGVSDNFDDYPNDKSKAFDNFYPSETTFGTLAFEDLWPGKGDFDFNDLVIDYQINEISNGDNEVVEIKAKYIIKAIGAGNHNGFGFEMKILPSNVTSVTGFNLTESYISLASNNLESGQSRAVVIVFDDAYDQFPPISHSFINTIKTNPTNTPDTMNIVIKLDDPVDPQDIGIPPYNPFIIVDADRDIEVHLPNKAPTDKADTDLFQTSSDDSKPVIGRYYKTDNNLPWAINIVDAFDYPSEKTPIINAHYKFANWAQSSGSSFKKWHQNKSGYRNPTLVFSW